MKIVLTSLAFLVAGVVLSIDGLVSVVLAVVYISDGVGSFRDKFDEEPDYWPAMKTILQVDCASLEDSAFSCRVEDVSDPPYASVVVVHASGAGRYQVEASLRGVPAESEFVLKNIFITADFGAARIESPGWEASHGVASNWDCSIFDADIAKYKSRVFNCAPGGARKVAIAGDFQLGTLVFTTASDTAAPTELSVSITLDWERGNRDVANDLVVPTPGRARHDEPVE